MSVPMHVTDAAFEESVLKSATPVIVDFWAPWCGPCRQVAPSLEKIAADYDGKVMVAKVNTDENPEWAQQYEVSGIPTMLFVAEGKIVYRQVGAVPFGYLKNIVDKFLEVVNAAPAPAVDIPATPAAPVVEAKAEQPAATTAELAPVAQVEQAVAATPEPAPVAQA
jgi:thioredoxin 1